jgi:diguanylate cyclase (GGDEF)-like protein
VVGQHLVGLNLVRQHLVRLNLVRQHLVRLNLVRQHLVRQRVDGSHVGLSPRRRLETVAPGAGATTTSPPVPPSVPLLTAALAVTALVLDAAVLHLHPLQQVGQAGGWRFVLAIVAFGVTEAIVLHVEIGRNAHTVSLAELALVVALFFVPLGALPIARLIGGGVVLLAIRRQRAVKAAFNASVWLLDVAVASTVFQRLHGGLDGGAFRLMFPVVAAAVAAAAVDSIAVNLVIALTSGEMRLRAALRFLVTCVIGAFASALLGVVCVGALASSPWLLLPIVLVATAVMAGFHAFGVLHRRHGNVKVLYDFTDALARTAHGDALVHTVLARVLELLRVNRAALWLDSGAGVLQVTTLCHPDEFSHDQYPLAETPPLVQQVLAGDSPVLVRPGEQRKAAASFLRMYDASEAVLVTVETPQGLRGVLVVADRLGDVTNFSSDDARLLQTLAHHAGAALDNSRLVQRLNHDSTHDSLTGLANRAYFQQRLDAVLASRRAAAVLLMDLDRFKEVNDTLGHHYGDLLLGQIAARLRREVREQDLLARLGGDEFGVVVTGLDVDDVVRTAERLRSALAAPMRLEGVDIEVNASIGIAYTASESASPRPTEAAAMLQQADVAMYTAKRNALGVHVYQPHLDENSPRRLALASGLRAAIETGQLALHYQPQCRLRDQQIVAVEALVRWQHPSYGEVPPEEFIGLAEQTGQIRELTRVVLDAAIAQVASWNEIGLALAVSVNISVRNLLEPDLAAMIRETLERHDVPSHQLTLEITESQLMADADRTRDTLDELANIGVRLSVDDFGTGYSSLAYLKQMPVAEVKIDKGFIRDLATDANDAAIVEAILQLAHTLRIEVVAEGVEDIAAERLLTELDCDYMQGYHLARPMTANGVTAWLTTHARHQRRGLRAIPAPRAAAAGAVSRLR